MNSIETVVGSGMRLTCSRDELAQALGVVSRGVSTRGAVQILGGMLLRAERPARARRDRHGAVAALSRRGRDRGREARSRARAPARRPRAAAARTAKSWSSTSPRRRAQVTCGPPTYKLHTYSAEDFPTLPDVDASLVHVDERRSSRRSTQVAARVA
jgi:hypothetical protein